jgi:hypothetical protein
MAVIVPRVASPCIPRTGDFAYRHRRREREAAKAGVVAARQFSAFAV